MPPALSIELTLFHVGRRFSLWNAPVASRVLPLDTVLPRAIVVCRILAPVRGLQKVAPA